MLNPPQQQVTDAGLLTSGFHVVLQFATGAGKTFLAEQSILNTVQAGQRCIYLSPLRSLAEELTNKWADTFAPHVVGVFTGDYGRNTPYPVTYEKARVMVMTPERLDACTRNWRNHWSWIPEVDLVVVDEAHLLGDRNRGYRLEGTLLRFMRLNPFARLIYLSATLGNRQELAHWLGGAEFHSDWRLVPISRRYVRFRKAAQKAELLQEEISRSVLNGEKPWYSSRVAADRKNWP